MPDIVTKIYAFRLKFVGRYFNKSHMAVWKHFLTYFLSRWKELGLSKSLFFIAHEKSLLSSLPEFYKEMFIALSKFYKVVP